MKKNICIGTLLFMFAGISLPVFAEIEAGRTGIKRPLNLSLPKDIVGNNDGSQRSRQAVPQSPENGLPRLGEGSDQDGRHAVRAPFGTGFEARHRSESGFDARSGSSIGSYGSSSSSSIGGASGGHAGGAGRR